MNAIPVVVVVAAPVPIAFVEMIETEVLVRGAAGTAVDVRTTAVVDSAAVLEGVTAVVVGAVEDSTVDDASVVEAGRTVLDTTGEVDGAAPSVDEKSAQIWELTVRAASRDVSLREVD